MHPYANTNASTTSRAQQAAQAVATALSNPYQYSSHYAQAYYGQQAPSSAPLRTPEGYSYSSTYNPSSPAQLHRSSQATRPPRGTHGFQRSRGGESRFHSQRGQQQQTHWYEPGDHRCTYEQCAFTGSKKSVEIHMMDRHLIYPPGWDKRKRKIDWDADPSLKNGKPIPILGTNIVLDTPEAVEAWIAERRKRWPTVSRVEEKEKKLKDALERGEIAANDPNLRGRKRPRREDPPGEARGQNRGRGRGRGAGRGGARSTRTVHPLPTKPVTAVPMTVEQSDDESSGSGSDMDPEKDAISSKPPPEIVEGANVPEEVIFEKEKERSSEDVPPQTVKLVFRRPAPQPRPPPSQRNPFANRPSLLRNLLLPEIRMTVSNLSQAIHFLVENEFLRDVELNPGDADNKPIEVISETNNDFLTASVPSGATEFTY